MHRDCDACTLGGAPTEAVNLMPMLFGDPLEKRFDDQIKAAQRRIAKEAGDKPGDPFESLHNEAARKERSKLWRTRKRRSG